MAPYTFEFSKSMIDILCPMFLTVGADGCIEQVGPTLSLIFTQEIQKKNFFEVFSVEKPRRVNDFERLKTRLGTKLVLTARPDGGDPIQFRSVATELHNSPGGLLLDLSFGTSLSDAIKRFNLSGADFKPNDFSIDLFYTFETQRALLDDSQKMTDALTSAKEAAEREANLDSLTGIANRRSLYQQLEGMLHRPKDDIDLALLHIDLDKFKAINDTFGHAAGDEILKHTAKVMEAWAGPDDLPVRIGGDEFALVLDGPHDKTSLFSLAENLIANITTPVRIDGHSCKVGASIGIVRFRAGDALSSDRLLINSDMALYEAKGAANGVKLLTPEMIRLHEERATLVSEIEKGIAEGQFVPYFQPQIDTKASKVCGLEVLARWDNPAKGVLSPPSFLEAANRANLMREIDRQVRQQAINAFATCRRDGVQVGKLSLNVTASNLRSPDFLEDLQDELFLAGLSPRSIQLELLESILFDQSDKFLIAQCLSLKAAGFTLALDDFGTGHAAISTLIEAPISTLKIDRSFVTGLDSNKKMQRITGAMLAMARQMGVDVMAEGVETRRELDLLEANGCRFFQGFYFSRPMAMIDLRSWLELWEEGQMRKLS